VAGSADHRNSLSEGIFDTPSIDHATLFERRSLSDVGALGVVRPGRIALMPYATTRCAGETTRPAHRGPYCNCARPRPLPAASDDDPSPRLHRRAAGVARGPPQSHAAEVKRYRRHATRSGVPSGSSTCIPVAGPPIPWVAVPKPSVNRLRSSRRMGFGSLVHSMNKIVKCSA